ncbi:MAG TPA: ABC transporter permease [Clostridia bacterium]|nr:ABC transporter permease [Clostridia bacterium]
MTFYEISMKMLIANLRRYRLYFLCNVFSVALFCSFAAILTNKIFMNPRIVDPMISSNIYAPSVFVGIFLVLFVPYSNNAFLRKRKYEYGVLMTLGMSEKEVLKNMLLESLVIAGLSLISGLVLGTVISFAFYFIIQHVIGIFALRWQFNVDSYKMTSILYCMTVLLTLVTGIAGFIKTQLIDLIKDKFKAEGKIKSRPGIFMAGLVFIFVSIMAMVIGYKYGNNTWIVSLGLMFIGLYMIITQVESVGRFIAKIFPDYMKKHITELSFVRQHHKSRSRISIIAAWLVGFSVFFAGLSMVLYPGLISNAMTYSPFDLVYSQVFGKNKVDDSEIQRLLSENGVSVKTVKQVDYLRGGAFNLLPASEVNKEFKCNYQISEGKFVTVFQFDVNDGYGHKIDALETVSIELDDKKMELQSAGKDVKILFNSNPTFANKTLILNDVDYQKIASQNREFWTGIMKLYTFDNWRDSGKGIAAVQKYLMEKNHVDKKEQHAYYRASSRIEAYATAKQSAEFLMFLMFFVVALLCGASNVMVHFKIKAEWEEEKRMLSGLYRIGVTSEEMLGMLKHKNMYYYMPQVMTGLLTGVFYNYAVNEFYGYGWKAAGYSLLVGMALVALQFVVVMRYSRRELLSFDI